MDESPAIGSRIAGRYRVERALGSGGMGTALLVHDELTTRAVALKLSLLESADAARDFREEFARLCGLYHPHLCRVHDYGLAHELGPERAFYTAELIDGQTLDHFARGVSWETLARPLAQAVSALGFLHQLGIRHGDFKPTNVIVTAGGEATLIDLGCSRPLAAAPEARLSGTPAYMAPELWQGAGGASADLYAVGVTLKKLAARLTTPLPEAIETLCQRLMRSDPRQRPSDTGELLELFAIDLGPTLPSAIVPPGFVGREHELAEVEQLLERLETRAAGPCVLWFCGPSGIGRTRMLLEAKWRAQQRMTVIEGNAAAADAIVSMLSRALGQARVRADVATVIATCEAVAARATPLLFVLDDAERLDPEQTRLLSALLRTLERTPNAAALVAHRREPERTLALSAARVLELGRLSARELVPWLGASSTPARVAEIERRSDGLPADVIALLGAPDSDTSDLDASRAQAWKRLSEPERQALTLVAVHDGEISEDSPLDQQLIEALAASSWLRWSRGFWRHQRITDAAWICEARAPQKLLRAHRRWAAWYRRRDPGRHLFHLAASGAIRSSARRLLAQRKDVLETPRAFRAAADELAKQPLEGEIGILIAELQRQTGDARRALGTIARGLRRRPKPELEAELRLAAGACYTQLGRSARARVELERASVLRASDEQRARALEQLSLTHLLSGDPKRALAAAERGLEHAAAPDLRVALHVSAALAQSYVGDFDHARAQIRAAGDPAGIGDVRLRFRCISAEAFVCYRAGETRAAADAYARAQDLAEAEGLDDQIVRAALNLGAASHQLGDWGTALKSYERALSLAVALGMTTTEITLLFDLAKLYADIGLFERAEHRARHALQLANDGQLGFLAAAAEAVLGEVALHGGDAEAARDHFERARDGFAREATQRERVEVELLCASLELDARELERLRAESQSLGAADVMARVELLRARFSHAQRDESEVSAALERARAHAASTEQQALKAEVETWSARLSNGSRQAARASWSAIGAGLPEALRDAFYAHPLRRAALELPSAVEPTRAELGNAPARELDGLRRLLTLYRRINRERRVDAVLESALDAAIELTHAERGFLILADTTQRGSRRWNVPVARNIDREELKGPRQKFSHSIACHAVEAREPVLVVDAGSDRRFSHEKSIGALHLRSVLAVPLLADDEALGAIYVDNRFSESSFDAEHVRLLVAFADQLAIALTKARLLEKLEARTRELETERARVVELLSSKEREVEELTRQLDTTRMRYDFHEIIGRSEPMRAVFARLERVVESNVTVLIGGESGTGKELVARALHQSGPRRDRPFVAINCGALPASLLEAELFGYKKGAFTGASEDREGLFVAAHGGTLFLDEIGEMQPEVQVKLLRALQESEVRPLGSSATIPVDVRVICATHRNLERDVADRRFREDLYYRIAVVTVTLPPLRDRAGDIPHLARSILARVAKSQNRPTPKLSAEAMRALQQHSWPGNVRELENVLTHALLFGEGPKIMPEDLELRSLTKRRRVRRKPGPDEAAALRAALAATGDNRLLAAQSLGMSRATFYRRLARYGLD